MFAASSGRTASVRLLLSHGADPAIRATVIDVPRRMAVDRAARRRLQEALEELRARDGADAGSGWTPSPKEAQEAIRAQREFLASEEAIREVLEGFTREDLATKRPSWDTPSGYESDVEIVAWPMYEMLVGASGGMTALLHAAREGHIETVEALLDGGADIDQVSADGSSPLLIALQNGRYDLAMELIERGANPSLATTTDGVTPLFAVLENQWAYNFTDTPHPRAQERQQAGYMDVLNALLEAGAEPNARLKSHLWYSDYLRGKMGINFTGATPFWRAAFAQDLEAMRALVAHGADPELPTAWPEPGMREGRQQDGRLQEDSGLPILPEGTPNMYPIHAAAGGGYMGLGAFMVSNVPNNFLNAVKYLVEEHGADVNWSDSWGYTPLHYASVRGDNALIEYLVSKGADVKAISRLGQSTADMARGGRAGYFSRSPFPETVELLQSLGSELRCLNTHFRGTGDFCPGSGAAPFEHIEADEERAVR
jgi:ankyrin repeat protein